ncbi:MAG TPA: SPASM domain-containing protein [Azospirillum sp.]|nr:SPASM domain-containing protein [Azospirillum sp.]
MSTRRTYALDPTAEASTRDCLDPWFFALLDSRRNLQPCCWRPPIGRLEPGQPLDALLDGPEMRALRRRLLDGDLDAHCAQCPNRALTTPANLRRRVRHELAAEHARLAAGQDEAATPNCHLRA